MNEAVIEPVASEQTITPEPPKLTRRQIGEIRRKYFTKEYSRVTKCGHKFDPETTPRTNCASCWEVYFRVVVDLVGLHADLDKDMKAVVAQRGKIFVKQFRLFVKRSLEEGQTQTS